MTEVHSKFHHAVDVLRFAVNATAPCALVCVTDINGGSMRAKGALMSVTDADVAGYISNGCVDGDIIFQARAAKAPLRLIYGEGSPFKDIALPCGGSIEVLIIPNPDKAHLVQVLNQLESREAAMLKVSGFEWRYMPKLRLRIAGRGAAVEALARQAMQSGFEVHLQSPDNLVIGSYDKLDHLVDPSMPPDVLDDDWSAVVLMFHDHDWEGALLEQSLNGSAFYIGAMGSPKTHDNRITMLQERGIAPDDIALIRGPIGIIPSMRDANLLALSTLAEIVKTAQEQGRL